MIDDHSKGRERLIFPRLGDVRWWHQVFNRTDDEMNGGAERDGGHGRAGRCVPDPDALEPVVGARFALRTSDASPRGGRSPARSPQPPALASSQSVLTGDKIVQPVLTPQPRSATSQPPPLKRRKQARTAGRRRLARRRRQMRSVLCETG